MSPRSKREHVVSSVYRVRRAGRKCRFHMVAARSQRSADAVCVCRLCSAYGRISHPRRFLRPAPECTVLAVLKPNRMIRRDPDLCDLGKRDRTALPGARRSLGGFEKLQSGENCAFGGGRKPGSRDANLSRVVDARACCCDVAGWVRLRVAHELTRDMPNPLAIFSILPSAGLRFPNPMLPRFVLPALMTRAHSF